MEAKTSGAAARPARFWDRVPLFRDMTERDIDAIGACLARRPFAAGEELIRQGVWRGELLIISTGVVEVSVEADEPDGAAPGRVSREVTLRRLTGGECVGEMSLLTGTPPSATVRALTEGEAWILGQADFLQLAMAHPALSRNVNAILSERLLHANRQQIAEECEQILLVVEGPEPHWAALAAAMAQLSRMPILFLDLTGPPGSHDASTHTLADLLSGRIRPSDDEHTPLLTHVDAVDETAENLLTASIRLGGTFRYVLTALPFGHPALPMLLASAARVLVVGSARAIPTLRARLAALPLTARDNDRRDLAVVLIDTPAALRPTVATLDLLSGELAVPVRTFLPAADEGRHAALLAFARSLVGQRIGLALGAGGAKGYAHLGVLRALERAAVPLDCVTGVSIGALVAAAVASGKTNDWIEAAFQSGSSRVFRPTVPLRGMLSNRALMAWLRSDEMYGEQLIEDQPLPFATSAADLSAGREIVVRRGPLWRAVLASAAIPGIYPPVRLGGHWLVDGGVVNPVPVTTAQLLGADIVIAVDLTDPLAPRQELPATDARSGRPPILPTTILRSRDIMMSEIRAHTVGEPSVLVKPRLSGVSLRSFSEGARFVAAGEEAVEAALPRLRKVLPWLDVAPSS